MGIHKVYITFYAFHLYFVCNKSFNKLQIISNSYNKVVNHARYKEFINFSSVFVYRRSKILNYTTIFYKIARLKHIVAHFI